MYSVYFMIKHEVKDFNKPKPSSQITTVELKTVLKQRCVLIKTKLYPFLISHSGGQALDLLRGSIPGPSEAFL